MLNNSDNLLFPRMFRGDMQGELFNFLFRDGTETDWCVAPWVLPLAVFLKTGVAFAFLQSSGISPVLHDLSKIMESDLAVTSAWSLSTHG